jgi:hypothetical protein
MAKQLDWTKTGTVEAMGEWLRSKSDAICVMVIRPDDLVFAIDPRCAPADAEALVLEHVTPLVRKVEQARQEKKRTARLELGPCAR